MDLNQVGSVMMETELLGKPEIELVENELYLGR